MCVGMVAMTTALMIMTIKTTAMVVIVALSQMSMFGHSLSFSQ